MTGRPLLLTVALAAASVLAVAATAQQALVVTQKRRAFSPPAIAINLNDTVVFLNDDGELLHHVHASSPRFSFDIGEQPAGTRVPVRFTQRGTFQVRCEIHPRMLLEVTVR